MMWLELGEAGVEGEAEEKKKKIPQFRGGSCSRRYLRYCIHTLHNQYSIHTHYEVQVHSLVAFYMSSEEEFGEFVGGAGQ